MFDWPKWLENISLVLLYISEYKWELIVCLVCSFAKWPDKVKIQSGILETVNNGIIIYALYNNYQLFG